MYAHHPFLVSRSSWRISALELEGHGPDHGVDEPPSLVSLKRLNVETRRVDLYVSAIVPAGCSNNVQHLRGMSRERGARWGGKEERGDAGSREGYKRCGDRERLAVPTTNFVNPRAVQVSSGWAGYSPNGSRLSRSSRIRPRI